MTMPPDETPPPQNPSQNLPGTADVFLSYAREDRPWAERIARALTEQGWSVWWDTNLVGGQRWQAEIDRALEAARCVVVLWSQASVQSHWVLDEAGEGMSRGLLVPAVVDDVEIPLGFRQAQTINLAGEEHDRALDDLIAGVARIVGGPKPEPRKPARIRLLKAWGPPVVAGLCAAVAILLYLYPIRETSIDLEVKASEVSFVSTRDQDIGNLMLVAAVDAAGLDSIGLPRARGRPEELLSAPKGRGLAIRLAPGNVEARTGAITLLPVSLSRSARVTLAGTDPRRFRISFNGSSVPVALNVQGPILMTMAGGAPELVDFGTPKPMLLEPNNRGAQIDITSAGEMKALLTSPVEIDALSLVRIDETVETRRTAVSTVSTIVSGTLQLEALRSRKQSVGPGEILRFGESHGEIRSLESADGGLLVRFHGRVRGMQSCAGNTCENRMPTYFESLAARHPAWVIALAAVFLLCAVTAGRRLIRAW